MTDVELLELHRGGSESAFPDLVRRHMGWVYGMARRRLRDSHLAEDVAQAVFVLLHRKAPRFSSDGAMINWLHKAAWYVSQTAVTTERRRRYRETEVAMIRPETVDPTDLPEWQQLAPLLDELIGRLKPPDRELILLRYYRDMTFAQVAAECRTTPEAARKRVNRAIEQLRRMAAEKGITASASMLAINLANCVRIPPPAGLTATATVTATARAGSALAGSSGTIAKGAMIMMASTKITFVAGTAVLLLILAGIVSSIVKWVATPSAPVAISPSSAPQTPAANLIALGNGRMPFSAVRWNGEIPQVKVNGAWYELVAVNDLTAAQIIQFAKSQFVPSEFKRQFEVNLSAILAAMGQQNFAVSLQLRTLTDGTSVVLENLPMTEENRSLIMFGTQVGAKAKDGTATFFSAVRWRGDTPEVQVNGDETAWYELLAVDDRPVAMIADFSKKTYGDLWQKHFADNSVEVLSAMGDVLPVNSWLELRTLDTKQQVTLLKIVVPSEKDPTAIRNRILAQRNALDAQRLAQQGTSASTSLSANVSLNNSRAPDTAGEPPITIEPATGSTIVVDTAAKEQVVAAIQKLADGANYSWMIIGSEAGLSGMGSEGKTQNDGLTSVTLGVKGDIFPTIIRGPKSVVNTKLGWKTPTELSDGSFRLTHEDRAPSEIEGFMSPGAVAKELADKVSEYQKVDDDAFFAKLPADAAQELISRPVMPVGDNIKNLINQTVTSPEGAVKFWVKDGVLLKFAYHVKGKVTLHFADPALAQRMGGAERELAMDKTILIEIKDVGTTKIEVPEEAQSKLD